MPDTFDLTLPTVPDDLVYEECRYVEKYSPYCIYIPKKDLMFKMMRACIGVYPTRVCNEDKYSPPVNRPKYEKECYIDFWIHKENEFDS